MIRSNETTLKDALEKLIGTYKLRGKLQETQLVANWEKVVGKMIDKHTRDLYIKSDKLYVKLDSAVVRQELMYARTQLLEKINEELGGKYIQEIIFL
jgi:predicted nucleic acid-binding Zn ribbon protein